MRVRAVLAVSLLAFLVAAFTLRCGGQQESGQPARASLTKVSIGIQVSPAMSLVMTAQARDYFRAEGIEVELKQFTAGKFALQAFLAGGIDYAVAGEVPVCLAALQDNPLRVIAQVVRKTTKEVRIVALQDGKPMQPAAWFRRARRRLATSFGGGPEFSTYTFLRYYGVGRDEVEILSQRPEDMPAALETGSVDAISIFDPFAYIAEQRLGKRAVSFANPQLYSELYLLVARPEQTRGGAQTIEAMLRALVRAADFVRRDPATAQRIAGSFTKLSPEVIAGIWTDFQFQPALSRELLQDWQEESEWARATGKVRVDAPMPNLRLLIDDRFLRSVDRKAVEL